MKKEKLLFCFILLFSIGEFQIKAQNVAINSTGVAPAASSMLDVSSTTMGMLVPRMTSVQRIAIPAPATGLYVYDLTTSTFWYFDGVVWVNMGSAAANWLLTGNTLAGTEFIGSNNAQPFVVRTSGIERMRVTPAGFVGVGTIAPVAMMHVVNTAATGTAVTGSMPNVTGHLGYVNNIALGSFGTVPGCGVFAADPTSNNYPSLVSVSSGAANYASLISFSDIWIGGFFGVDNASAIYNPPCVYGQLNETGSVGGFQPGVEGYHNRTSGGNPGYSVGVEGIAVGNQQDGMGIMGQYSGSGTGVRCGGYLTAGGNFDYVADNILNRKITGNGTVSEIIPTEDHGRIMLTCPESPEYWYQDYGTVQLINGHAHVNLDPILSDIIIVDSANALKVFLQVNMTDCNGVAVVNKSANGFDLVEVNGGNHSGEVDYQIIARPKTNYGEGRFPQGPGPAGGPKEIPAAAKAQNSGNRDTMFRWPADQTVYGYTLIQPQPVAAQPKKR
jgi:hypothetical protein